MDNILQWSVRGASSAKQDLLQLIDTYHFTIIAIQETFLGGDFKIKLPGFNGICQQGHYNHRFHGGVALYIHSSLPYEQLEIDSPHQVIAARIQLSHHSPIAIASIYLPGREQVTNQSLIRIIQQLPTPFILLGDFNAHHENWGTAPADARGRIISTIINNMQLNCLNDGSPTHESGTSIDLTICNPNITPILTWTVLDSLLSSDHHPIMISTINQNNNDVQQRPRYNYKKANWDSYTEDAIWNTLSEVDNQINNATLLEEFYDKLYKAADHHIPLFIPKRFFPAPFWNDECKRLYAERERLYKLYKRTGSLAHKINWKRIRAITKQTIRQSKKKNFKTSSAQ